MGYQATISGKDNLTKLFSVYEDVSLQSSLTKNTYVLVPKITSCEYVISSYKVRYKNSKGENYSTDEIIFYHLNEVDGRHEEVDFDQNEIVTLEFKLEEEALYFQMKYGS